MNNFDMPKRELLASDIVNIVKNYKKHISVDNDSLVISINAEWGMGKTYFLNGLENILANESYIRIFKFNAWQHDLFDNPLCPFMDSIFGQSKLENIAGNIVNNVITLGKYIGKTAIINFVSNKIGVNLNEISNKVESLSFSSDEMASILLNTKNDFLQEFQEFKQAKESFEKYLKNFDVGMTKVFIIDELDRCRPDYSIKLLETIKHFFNIDDYVFIFALDYNQLVHSAKKRYGNDIDANGYMRRFFDLSLNLPRPDIKTFLHSIESNNLINNTFVVEITELFNLSLRELKTIIRNFQILSVGSLKYLYEKPITQNKVEERNFFFFMIALRYKKPQIYFSILHERVCMEKDSVGTTDTFVPVPREYYRIDAINPYLKLFHLGGNTRTKLKELPKILQLFDGEAMGDYSMKTISEYVEYRLEVLQYIE